MSHSIDFPVTPLKLAIWPPLSVGRSNITRLGASLSSDIGAYPSDDNASHVSRFITISLGATESRTTTGIPQSVFTMSRSLLR